MNTKPDDSSAPTLVVFCRRPAPGNGKQRIARIIGVDPTFDLATHLLATALEDARTWPGPVIISPAAAADRRWAETLLSTGHRVCPQPDGNLGERINAVDRDARAQPGEHLIYIGSDAPLLDDAYFAQARAALTTHDIVLGTAEDGGVVLMGARVAWPELAPLPWSSADLGAALELLCRQSGLTVKRLPSRYDIDFVEQLPRLHADLCDDRRPARRALREWLAATGYAASG